jgi:hypothetical protein
MFKQHTFEFVMPPAASIIRWNQLRPSHWHKLLLNASLLESRFSISDLENSVVHFPHKCRTRAFTARVKGSVAWYFWVLRSVSNLRFRTTSLRTNWQPKWCKSSIGSSSGVRHRRFRGPKIICSIDRGREEWPRRRFDVGYNSASERLSPTKWRNP